MGAGGASSSSPARLRLLVALLRRRACSSAGLRVLCALLLCILCFIVALSTELLGNRIASSKKHCYSLNVTFFTSFKSHNLHSNGGNLNPVKDMSSKIRQANAVSSWLQLPIKPLVYVFGNEEQVKEQVVDIDNVRLRHIDNVRTSKTGAPLFNSMMSMVRKAAPLTDVFVFANADIIFMTDFGGGLGAFCDAGFLLRKEISALGIGQRFDVPIHALHNTTLQRQKALKFARKDPRAHFRGFPYVDYFIIPPSFFQNDFLPPLTMGRAGVDDWLVSSAWVLGKHLVDLTPVITAYHQIHTYRHLRSGVREAWYGHEAQINLLYVSKVAGAPFLFPELQITGGAREGFHIKRNLYNSGVKFLYRTGILWLFSLGLPILLVLCSIITCLVISIFYYYRKRKINKAH